jgi:hypothetical protein
MNSRSRWPRGLRCWSAAFRVLGLWVRIPMGAWISVSFECCMLSSWGLCDGPITLPEESHQVWWVSVNVFTKPRKWEGLCPLRLSGHERKTYEQMFSFHPVFCYSRQWRSIVIVTCIIPLSSNETSAWKTGHSYVTMRQKRKKRQRNFYLYGSLLFYAINKNIEFFWLLSKLMFLSLKGKL